MSTALPLPFDIRLMNAAASLLASVFLLTCLAAGMWWVLRNPVFAITEIAVSGDMRHNSAVSLRAGVAERLQGNFFTLDLESAQSAFESVPWVRKAFVRREFPNRLHVELQEHVPVARWGEGEAQLVDEWGEVFDTGGFDGSEGTLPLLVGPEGQSTQMLAIYQQLNPMLAAMNTRITTLELQPRGHWRAELAPGAVIELGQGAPELLVTRMARFVHTASEVASRYGRGLDAIEVADLRHGNGYAIRMHGVSTGIDAHEGR